MRSPRAALLASVRHSDEVIMTRSLAYVQLAGAGMAVLFALVIPSTGVDSAGMLTTALVAAVFASLLLRSRPAEHRAWIPLAGLLSTTLISLYVFLGGESATPFALFYAVTAGATVWCMSKTETALQVAWMVASYSLAVWITPEADQAPWPAIESADVGAMLTLAVTLSALTILVWEFKSRFVDGDRRAAALVEFSRDAITGVDTEGRLTTWNRGAEEMYGYDRREVIGQHASLLSPPELRSEQADAIAKAMDGEELRDIRTRRVRRDGEAITVTLSVSPVLDAEGNAIGCSAIHHDITAEVAAAERLALQAAMIDEVDGAVIVTEAGGTISYWSRGAARLFGYSAEEVAGTSVYDLLSSDDRRRIELMRDSRAPSMQLEGEIDAISKAGDTVPVYFRSRDVSGVPEGSLRKTITVAVDIAARREAERAAERRMQAQREVAELGRRALHGETCESLFASAVSAAERVLGADKVAVLEWRPGDRGFVVAARSDWEPEATGLAAGNLATHLAEEVLRASEPVVLDDWREDALLREEDERDARVSSSAGVRVGEEEHPFGVLLVRFYRPGAVTPDAVFFLQAVANLLTDALRSREARREIRRQSLHDPLTGLPNRGLFVDRVERALERAGDGARQMAVLVFDVDHFKVINESLGHAAGDEILVRLRSRLQDAVRPGDTIARLTGGEFAVLCEQLPSPEAAGEIADRMLAATREPVLIADGDYALGASVGIAIARPGSTAGDLLRDADSALGNAKSRGRGRFEVFRPQMRAKILDRVRVEAALRDALAAGDQIHPEYQPLVSLSTGGIIGAEALARWTHPSWGPVPPTSFIPVAEQSGYVHELGRAVMFDALRDAAGWRSMGEFRGVAVNVSPVQLADPAEVSGIAIEALHAARLPAAFLTIEITEGVLIEQLESVSGTLSSLIGLGLGLSLDDFGTGYSSLSYLGELPFDSVKIDRSLIRDIVGNARAASLASAIVEMGHALGKVVIAEGIETPEQAILLRKLGCDVGQGFHFSRPLTAEAFRSLLTEHPRFAISPVAGAEARQRTRRPAVASGLTQAGPAPKKPPAAAGILRAPS